MTEHLSASANNGLNDVNKKLVLNRFDKLVAQQENVQKLAESTPTYEKKLH